MAKNDLYNMRDPAHAPVLRAPKLPTALSLFPVTRAMHAALYRGRLEDHEVFRRAVEAECSSSTVALDVGAGRGAPPAVNVRGKVARVIGVDVAPDVADNPNVDEGHVGSVEHMPYITAGSIDLAYARYVAEHLERPLEALRELRRVLRMGGRLLFITPNRRHYVPAIASRLGLGAHRVLNALRGRPTEDTFPTVYALNTVADILRIGHQAGFSNVEIAAFESQPNYLTFHPGVFAAGVLYERVVNATKHLEGFRGSLLARLTA